MRYIYNSQTMKKKNTTPWGNTATFVVYGYDIGYNIHILRRGL